MIWFINWNRNSRAPDWETLKGCQWEWTGLNNVQINKKYYFTFIPSEPVRTNVKPQDCSFPWFENKQGKDRGWHRWEENFTCNLFDDDGDGGDGDVDDHHGGVGGYVDDQHGEKKDFRWLDGNDIMGLKRYCEQIDKSKIVF